MKQKANKYYAIILQGILIFFSVNAIMGRVAFGYGLGDLFYLPILWIITIIYLTTFLLNRNKNNMLLITNLLITIPAIWIILTATIWRGGEHSWNGHILFLPCRKEIPVENQKTKRKINLQMCTMEYYSDFTGIWNGKEMEKISGEIKIPQKLKKHLDYPIKNILLQPAHYNQWNNGIEIKIYRYKTDTLKIRGEYKLGGEIIKIVDRMPMIQARIK